MGRFQQTAFRNLQGFAFCIFNFVFFLDILSTADLNSADENLAFSIAHAPQRGHLESTDSPGLPITSFTQLDLAGKMTQDIHANNITIFENGFNKLLAG